MILLAHILIALSSVVLAIMSVVRPKTSTVTATNYSTAATIASGVVLALTSSVSLGHLCASGLLVVGFCLASVAYAKKQLARAT